VLYRLQDVGPSSPLTDKLIQIVERYFSRLRDEHGLGAGTDERSYYPALAELLNALGHELKPKVLCLSDLANTGAGHPDFGLYAANQVQKGEPRKGQPPERGVIEMKGVNEETWFTAESRQVSKYFGAYQLVVVSNLRAFLIVGEGPTGEATKLEGFQHRVRKHFGRWSRRQGNRRSAWAPPSANT
jgi:hypothetical protein